MRRRRARRWKSKRRLRRLRRRPLLLAVAGLVVCGGASIWLFRSTPDDFDFQRARVALAHRKPDLALQLIRSHLQANPRDLAALSVAAASELALNDLDAAGKTLARSLAIQGEHAETHDLLARWSLLSLRDALNDLALMGSPGRQQEFDRILQVGLGEARWLMNRADKVARRNGRMLEVRLIDADIRRLQTVQTLAEGGSHFLAVELNSKVSTIKAKLDTILSKEAENFEAWYLYLRACGLSGDTDGILAAAQTLGDGRSIPGPLAAAFVDTLMAAPSSAEAVHRRMESVRRVLAKVNSRDRGSVSVLLATARLHLWAGKPEEAESPLRAILRVESGHLLARYLLAGSMVGQGRYAEATSVLQSLVQTPPVSPQTFDLLARTLWQQGMRDDAWQVLRQGIELTPAHVGLHATMFELAAQGGRLSQVVDDIRRLRKTAPHDPPAIRLLLRLETRLGRREAQRELLARLEGHSTVDRDTLLLLIDGYLSLGEFDKVVQHSRMLLRRYPNRIEGRLGLITASLARGRVGDALGRLDALEDRFPGDVRLTKLRGRCYALEGRLGKTAALYERLLEASPDDYETRVQLAQVMLALGFLDEARAHAEKALAVSPTHTPAHAVMARLYAVGGSPTRHLDYLAGLDEERIDPAAHPVLLAQVKFAKGREDEALRICEEALAAGHTDPVLRLLLARWAEQRGALKEAEVQLLSLARDQPDYPDVYRALTQFYDNHGLITQGLLAIEALDHASPYRAGIAAADLLRRANRSDEARQRLEDLYPAALSEHSPLALEVADQLVSILVSGGDLAEARTAYDRLNTSGQFPVEAALRCADLALRDRRGNSLATLDDLSTRAPTEDGPFRFELMRRYVALGRHDRALGLLDQWLLESPNHGSLLSAKAELLAESGRFDEAADLYRLLATREVQSAAAWQRLAQMELNRHDFPGAEAALRAVGTYDEQALPSALVKLGRMYAMLGLKAQAAAAFDRLAQHERPRNPDLLLSMARVNAVLGRDAEALQALKDIPAGSSLYAQAQVGLARSELIEGKEKPARSRLRHVLNHPRHRASAVQALIAQSSGESDDETLFTMADLILGPDITGHTANGEELDDPSPIADDIQRAWLGLRVGFAMKLGDWRAALEGLNGLARGGASHPQVDAGRVAILLHLDRKDEALRIATRASLTPVARMLIRAAASQHPRSIADGEGPGGAAAFTPPATKGAAFAQLLFALATHDKSLAGQSLLQFAELSGAVADSSKAGPPFFTVFSADLATLVGETSADRGDEDGFVDTLALAELARQAGLPDLCAEVLRPVTVGMGRNSRRTTTSSGLELVGWSLYTQCHLARTPHQLVTGAFDALQQRFANSSLAAYFRATRSMKESSWAQALEELQALREREPGSGYIQHLLARAQVQAGKVDQAVVTLRDLLEQRRPMQTESEHAPKLIARPDGSPALELHGLTRIQAANDLAYLLANHYPDRLDEAWALADAAWRAAPLLPASLDTLGWIEHLRGSHREALKHLCSVLVNAAPRSELHEHLASVYDALGNETWAAYHRGSADHARLSFNALATDTSVTP